MVVIAKKVGRLANRLLLFAHFIGTALEHGFHVANPAFGSYAHYFPSTARDLFCRFPKATPTPSMGRYGRELFYRAVLGAGAVLFNLQQCGRDVGLIRLRRDQRLDLDSPAFLSALRGYDVLFVQDWFFRSSVNCRKHGDLIRRFFTPWQRHLDRARELVGPARKRDRFLVGVHLRQGDYATFKDGRFFYSHPQYRQAMEKVQEAFPQKNVSFLICSDAPAPAEVFAGLDVLHGNGHELEDLYALARCDRLIGPPSTYSKWASFYGLVPRYEIFNPAHSVNPESFRVADRLIHEAQGDDQTAAAVSVSRGAS